MEFLLAILEELALSKIDLNLFPRKQEVSHIQQGIKITNGMACLLRDPFE
jgi:hypothetical protein